MNFSKILFGVCLSVVMCSNNVMSMETGERNFFESIMGDLENEMASFFEHNPLLLRYLIPCEAGLLERMLYARCGRNLGCVAAVRAHDFVGDGVSSQQVDIFKQVFEAIVFKYINRLFVLLHRNPTTVDALCGDVVYGSGIFECCFKKMLARPEHEPIVRVMFDLMLRTIQENIRCENTLCERQFIKQMRLESAGDVYKVTTQNFLNDVIEMSRSDKKVSRLVDNINALTNLLGLDQLCIKRDIQRLFEQVVAKTTSLAFQDCGCYLVSHYQNNIGALIGRHLIQQMPQYAGRVRHYFGSLEFQEAAVNFVPMF